MVGIFIALQCLRIRRLQVFSSRWLYHDETIVLWFEALRQWRLALAERVTVAVEMRVHG